MTSTRDSEAVARQLGDFDSLPAAIRDWEATGNLDNEAVHEMLASEVARLVRSADRSELFTTATVLDAAASNSRSSTQVWSWAATLLEAAADAVGESSLAMHVKGHAGKSELLVRALAECGGVMPRTDLQQRIAAQIDGELSDSHLSHILRDLDDAGLVDRARHGREIVVSLTSLGRNALGDEQSKNHFDINIEAMFSQVVAYDDIVQYRMRETVVGWGALAT